MQKLAIEARRDRFLAKILHSWFFSIQLLAL